MLIFYNVDLMSIALVLKFYEQNYRHTDSKASLGGL